MFKRIMVVLREQHIGKVMYGVFVLFALRAVADATGPLFLNRVVHWFNVHSTEFPHFEPVVSRLQIALKAFDVVLFSVLAWLFYRWFCMRREGEQRG